MSKKEEVISQKCRLPEHTKNSFNLQWIYAICGAAITSRKLIPAIAWSTDFCRLDLEVGFFSITFTFALNNYSKYYPTCLNFLHSGCQMFHNVPDNCTNSCSERYKWYLWLSPVSADMICHSWLPWILLLYRTIPMIYSESLKASGHPAGSGIEQSHQQSQCQISSLCPTTSKGIFHNPRR